ncbi:uncharacterized protein LOC117640458 [Thrips palmi]|uniref:Uncharacterized protein LOC117640458 n=1 Tax=Thrips palmi TaxID=161013 RepID=A0A6P8Y897_THRPL|nr:uncharacterized protein LOC117640458 [Thrips palmi]XP_034232855.1 uncharacterized protein LOC117640458 [Thrips palmi]
MSSGEHLLMSKEAGESKDNVSEEHMDYEDTSFSEGTSQGQDDSQESQETSLMIPQGNLIINDGQEENEDQDIPEDEQMGYEDTSYVEGAPVPACADNENSEAGRATCITEMPRNDGISVIANTAEAEAYLSGAVIREAGTIGSTTELSLNSEDVQALNEVSENEEHHSLVPYSSEDSAGMDTADDETNAETEVNLEADVNAEHELGAEVNLISQGDVNVEYETQINTEDEANIQSEENIEYENEAETIAEENISYEASAEQDVSTETEENSLNQHLVEQEMEAEPAAEESETDFAPEGMVENAESVSEAEAFETYDEEGNNASNVYDVQEPQLIKSTEGETSIILEGVAKEGDLELCSVPDGQVLALENEDSGMPEEQELPQENEDSTVHAIQEIIHETDSIEGQGPLSEDTALLDSQHLSQENDDSVPHDGQELPQESDDSALPGGHELPQEIDSVLPEGQESPQENDDSILSEGQELPQEDYEPVMLEDQESTQETEDPCDEELPLENEDSSTLSTAEAGEEAVDQSNEDAVQNAVDDNAELVEDMQDAEDDGEGEEYVGEEEEFEDGDEMAEEVEVEIEDCSDPEMESEGGVTYIISEGMIVVEENESSEAYQTADNGAAIEEEEDSVVPKTTRIVIKVPSSKSVNDTILCSEEMGTEVVKQEGQSLILQELGDVSNASHSEQPTINEVEPINMKETESMGDSNEVLAEEDLPLEPTGEIDGTTNEGDLGTPAPSSLQEVDPENPAGKEDTQPAEFDCGVDTAVQQETELVATDESISPNMLEESQCEKAVTNEEVAAQSNESLDVIATSSVSSKTNAKNQYEKIDDIEEAAPKNSKPKGISTKSEQKQVNSAHLKSAEKTIGKTPSKPLSAHAPSKSESKGSKPSSNNKSHLPHEKEPSESVKKRQPDSGDSVKRSSKHTHGSAHKHKSQNETKTSTSVKTISNTETAAKEEHSSKGDSAKKHVEGKDRSLHNESTHSSKNVKQPLTSSHRTRSSSSTPKESSSRDKRSAHKEEGAAKKSNNAVSRSDDSLSSSKSNSDSKVSLRSSRSRKSHSDAANEVQDPPTVKKEKAKTSTETPQKPRQSERVSKATEKALASGLISRRSRTTAGDSATNNSERPSDSLSEDQAPSQRRGKRKADSSPPPAQEETPSSKRRVTRSGEGSQSSDSPAQSLRSVRKNKTLKRKGSTGDSPPSKHAHKEDPKDKATDEFIANIPNMCRICGSKNDNLINVFGPEGQTMKLSEKVHNILPIKMRQEEPLPSGVCHSCVVTLIACEKLVEKCTSIDKRLRSHYNCHEEKPVKENIQPVKEIQPETLPKSSVELSKAEKSVKSDVAPTSKSAELSSSKKDEAPSTTHSSKVNNATRSSSRVSAKKQLESSQKPIVNPPEPETKTTTAQEVSKPPVVSKANVASSPETEDAPPVLEAEPPQSHLPPTNQEPAAQPPVLVPQPGKPLPELVPIPADDSGSMKRFGNTYRARMKPGQWEKIERGLEAIHGESHDEDEENTETKSSQAEEFHIVDLDMNVEEVQETPATPQKNASSQPEFHVEIPSEAIEEETTAQQSSPKSVIDSILVDWSGDEDDVVPEKSAQNASAVSSGQRAVSAGKDKDSVNGSSRQKPIQRVSKAPCLFGEDEEGDAASTIKLKPEPAPSPAPAPTPVPDTVVIKQESFWPEPAPGTSTTSTSEKPSSDVPWKCFVCGKRGKSLPKFLEHKKLHLNDRKLVSCPKCSESFSNMALLKSHMKSSHGDDEEDDVVAEQQQRQTRRRSNKQQSHIVDVDLAPATDGLYHCSLCQSAFTNIESLCQHKLTHQKGVEPEVRSDKYKCTYCRKTFYEHKEFQTHLASHQTGPNLGMFQCGKCDMKMVNQKEFIEHIESHNSEDSFQCDHCDKVFDTKHKLRSHRSTVHKSTAYACHLCDKVCQKRITLIEHLRKHTGDNPFACPVCNKRFNRLANYKAHMTIHENARRYECPYCGKRFNRQSIQQRHIKTHTSEQSRKHRCRVCNLTFGLATEMFTHRRLHTRDEVERATWEDEKLRLALTSFPCKVCQLPFNTVEEVLAHMPSHTDDERDIAAKLKNPRLECDICGKVLNSKRTFNAHRSSHIDGKPYVCKICSKGYATSTGLNYHMLSHTGERPFPCTFCNKGYKNSTDLKVHMRQHTGEFPYKCNLCNKAFRSASSLQKHGFVHTENRPFKCQYCNMSFKRESTKHNHERIHTNDRRFKCKVCSRTFIQKGACDAHERLHFRGGTQVFMTVEEGAAAQRLDSRNVEGASGSKTDKHDLFDDFEEEDFDEDDEDDEDEYIIYEDDSVEDGDNDDRDEEEMAESEKNVLVDPLRNDEGISKSPYDESKSSNGVDLPVTSITPVPVTLSGDSIPNIGDNSVHITIL